jgi:hypothetical protein
MNSKLSFLACLGIALFLTKSAQSAEEKIKPEELPKAVAAAIKARFPGGEIRGAEKEIENQKTVFDIELLQKGLHYEMDVQEDGTLLEVEKEVLQKDWPQPLPGAIAAKYPAAKIKIIMHVFKVDGNDEKPQHYEATLTKSDGKDFEVIVSLDGQTVSTEEHSEAQKD